MQKKAVALANTAVVLDLYWHLALWIIQMETLKWGGTITWCIFKKAIMRDLYDDASIINRVKQDRKSTYWFWVVYVSSPHFCLCIGSEFYYSDPSLPEIHGTKHHAFKGCWGKKGGADYSEPKQHCSCIIFTNIYNIHIKKQPTWVLRILTFIGIYLSSPSAFLGSMPVT